MEINPALLRGLYGENPESPDAGPRWFGNYITPLPVCGVRHREGRPLAGNHLRVRLQGEGAHEPRFALRAEPSKDTRVPIRNHSEASLMSTAPTPTPDLAPPKRKFTDEEIGGVLDQLAYAAGSDLMGNPKPREYGGWMIQRRTVAFEYGRPCFDFRFVRPEPRRG
jgi:hypothetical protein